MDCGNRQFGMHCCTGCRWRCPPEQPARRGRLPRLFLPLLRGVRRGGLMGARGMPRGPQGRGREEKRLPSQAGGAARRRRAFSPWKWKGG